MGFSLKRIWQAYAFEHPQFWQRIDAPVKQDLTAYCSGNLQSRISEYSSLAAIILIMIEFSEIDTRDLVHHCLYTPAVWAFTRFTSRPIVQLSMPLIRYGGPSLWQAVTNYIQTSLVTCTQFRLFIREHTNPSDTNFALTGRQ